MTARRRFQVLLARYTRTGRRGCVGTPVADRNRPEAKGLIGFFVNTLVLRGRLVRRSDLRDTAATASANGSGAYAHQDLPFEKLVEELQPARDLSRNPLFQMMFILQNVPSRALDCEEPYLAPRCRSTAAPRSSS